MQSLVAAATRDILEACQKFVPLGVADIWPWPASLSWFWPLDAQSQRRPKSSLSVRLSEPVLSLHWPMPRLSLAARSRLHPDPKSRGRMEIFSFLTAAILPIRPAQSICCSAKVPISRLCRPNSPTPTKASSESTASSRSSSRVLVIRLFGLVLASMNCISSKAAAG